MRITSSRIRGLVAPLVAAGLTANLACSESTTPPDAAEPVETVTPERIAAPETPSAAPTTATEAPVDDLCERIEATPFRELPRKAVGNQLDPSGLAFDGRWLWFVNDREGRKGAPPEGNGLYRLDPSTGEMRHVPVPGLDRASRKFEGLAYDGRELHAIGNVGDREANTFLFSIAVDPDAGELVGEARFHDLATGLGRTLGYGSHPWGHGLKVEGLASTAPGNLLLGLRATGAGKAARAYRTGLTDAGAPPGPLGFDEIPTLDGLDLGIARGGPGDMWRQARGVSGLADAVGDPPMVLGVAAAEYERKDVDAFLSNALYVYWPEADRAELLCTFDEGQKAEGIAVAPTDASAQSTTLYLLYDNDSMAAGSFKVVEGVRLPVPSD